MLCHISIDACIFSQFYWHVAQFRCLKQSILDLLLQTTALILFCLPTKLMLIQMHLLLVGRQNTAPSRRAAWHCRERPWHCSQSHWAGQRCQHQRRRKYLHLASYLSVSCHPSDTHSLPVIISVSLLLPTSPFLFLPPPPHLWHSTFAVTIPALTSYSLLLLLLPPLISTILINKLAYCTLRPISHYNCVTHMWTKQWFKCKRFLVNL